MFDAALGLFDYDMDDATAGIPVNFPICQDDNLGMDILSCDLRNMALYMINKYGGYSGERI